MRRAFSRPRYLALALIAGAIVFVSIRWISIVPIVVQMSRDASLDSATALSLITELLCGALVDGAAIDIFYTAVISVLIGINIALLVFSFRMYRSLSVGALTSGVSGSLAALLGFGCAACGGVFVLSLVGSGSASTAALWALADAGVFRIISIVLLLIATAVLGRAINKPVVCPI